MKAKEILRLLEAKTTYEFVYGARIDAKYWEDLLEEIGALEPQKQIQFKVTSRLTEPEKEEEGWLWEGEQVSILTSRFPLDAKIYDINFIRVFGEYDVVERVIRFIKKHAHK